ncbi:NAD-glutamate dehydrogenase [Marinobacterium rhizophilum]|uniref:NAD-glutamate dehydrogenase n=1 Tax=Marinobacterium rhizophilum TaxID=420402 RepID=UPI0003645528|nr:NAD-glutamate dehydrogenase [Marinobacterium rhizophilum]
MYDVTESPKGELLKQLSEQFNDRLDETMAAAVCNFARQYYRATLQAELVTGQPENLYGVTLSVWQFIQELNGAGPKVRVFNPDFERHGWHSKHTVIEILNPDMPFLVDSIRMELIRQELSIHALHNAVLRVVRDPAGVLVNVAQPDEPSKDLRRESVVYLEVDRHNDVEDLKAIQASLLDVFRDVWAAVQDFDSMKAEVRTEIERLGTVAKEVDSQAVQEAKAFLEWLLVDHFTFLACDELQVSRKGDATRFKQVSDSELGTLRCRDKAKRNNTLTRLRDCEREFILASQPLMFAKAASKSRVHRPAYQDLVVVKHFDDAGGVIGEKRFYGLYTSAVYDQAPASIPVIRQNVAQVLEQSNFEPGGHNRKELLQILKGLPREELFLSTADKLFETAIGIFNLQEMRKVRLFVRPDRCGRFVSCLYFAPREIYGTDLRTRVQNLLVEHFNALDAEFTTHFSESILARTHFVLRLDPDRAIPADSEVLEAHVIGISRAWDEELHRSLVEVCGEEQGNRYANLYRGTFSSAYREHFPAGNAIYDIQRLDELSPQRPLSMSFYRKLEQSRELLRFKLFTADQALVLSDMIPILENLGMRVLGEHPYEVRRRDGRHFWLHDFTLQYNSNEPVELEDVKSIFQDAFGAIWQGQADNDEFNRLVVGGKFNWREVALLRAYTRYNRQLRFEFSQPYIADALARHLYVTKLLVNLFKARFDPARRSSDKADAVVKRLEASVLEALDQVDNLNDDRILRRLLELIKATLRTNYFQTGADDEPHPYIAFKLDPGSIANIPRPRPMFETFVYSPRVEGVHLRGGKVARGGLRWSDRLEDYRTEVLGLVKAQQVKNAVIVPVGAKGGFVAKCLPEDGGREAIQAEGIACYKVFIRALLDLADNLVAGQLVPPADVVRHDGDDPYLVVAADKGTATFSDIANEIAAEYGFWLGDAFASGGSQGYDHKGMGITARGAWESVKRHFRELGLDTQSEPFTVVGVGDMAGDVFGNGLLLSPFACLVAAFNHQHIFIDPNPDAAAAFKERERMFALPRSSWADYDASLISSGGGIFPRQAKSIAITDEMRERFDIQAQRLTPNELISALLRAPVDLLWNGGIGTYVKASQETHADVGDKANDAVRINGAQLRCRVLGEGGNLGFTQLGRIEFALNGGACNTDFIDNAGGVDCSDHEVNIKILLNEVVAAGDMTVKQRNLLLKEMTDDVAQLVLNNNYHQVQALSLAKRHARESQDEYIRLIDRLEADGKLDRELEFIPGDEELQLRKGREQGLTLPEFSVLISYVKAELKQGLNCPAIYQDSYLAREVDGAFPARIVQQFPDAVTGHRLRNEILATQLANGMVNRMGISFVSVVRQATGADDAEIAKAYVIAREVFRMDEYWQQIEALDGQVPADVQVSMMAELVRLVRRSTFWFVRHQPQGLDVAGCIDCYRPGVETLSMRMSDLIHGSRLKAWDERKGQLLESGVGESLAAIVASCDSLFSLLGIIQIAQQIDQPVDRVGLVYFTVGDCLDMHWFAQQVRSFDARSHWEALACEGYLDEVSTQQRALTAQALRDPGEAETARKRVGNWLAQHPQPLKRWQAMLEEMRSAQVQDCAIFSVALRELQELSQA